jgi:hypothetical protein
MAARLTKLLVLAALALAVAASSGSAASPGHTRILGVVPHTARLPLTPHALTKAVGAASATTLSFDSSYETLINQYFTNVAHDSTGVQNVYSVATQYYDSPPKAFVQYQSTFAGSYVAHNPLPASGCSDGSSAYCLTDQQLQDEIQTVLTAKGWQGGLSHMFFLMTPDGVGSCEFAGAASNQNPCSTTFFCAYHSAFPLGNQAVIYANEPYEGPVVGCSDPFDQGFPNDGDSDTTINTISHEHNEAITDPLGSGWIAADGQTENGDLCAYSFGTEIGGTPGIDAYNQVINHSHYDLQQEYSNADSGCILHTGDPSPSPPTSGSGPLLYNNGPVMHTNTTYAIYWLPTAGNTSPPVVTGTALEKHTLTTSPGSWNGAPNGFRAQWQRCSAAGTGCVNISGATATTYKLTTADGGHTVRSTVSATNVNGTSAAAASTHTAVVLAFPANTKAPHISGHSRVGKKLSGSHGTWTFAPTSYRYQWLRCNGHGGSCSVIHHATHSTYKLTKRDAKHRLRVRVTATNAAGSTVATSAASARVPVPTH